VIKDRGPMMEAGERVCPNKIRRVHSEGSRDASLTEPDTLRRLSAQVTYIFSKLREPLVTSRHSILTGRLRQIYLRTFLVVVLVEARTIASYCLDLTAHPVAYLSITSADGPGLVIRMAGKHGLGRDKPIFQFAEMGIPEPESPSPDEAVCKQ
jgi:hypothetical protein